MRRCWRLNLSVTQRGGGLWLISRRCGCFRCYSARVQTQSFHLLVDAIRTLLPLTGRSRRRRRSTGSGRGRGRQVVAHKLIEHIQQAQRFPFGTVCQFSHFLLQTLDRRMASGPRTNLGFAALVTTASRLHLIRRIGRRWFAVLLRTHLLPVSRCWCCCGRRCR